MPQSFSMVCRQMSWTISILLQSCKSWSTFWPPLVGQFSNCFSLIHSFQQTLCPVFSLLCTWYSLWETSLLCWSPKNMSSSSDESFTCIEICLTAPARPYFSTINYIFISEGFCLLSYCSFHLSSRASGWLFRTSRSILIYNRQI